MSDDSRIQLNLRYCKLVQLNVKNLIKSDKNLFNQISLWSFSSRLSHFFLCLFKNSFSILILKLESNLNKFVRRYEFYKLTVRLFLTFHYLMKKILKLASIVSSRSFQLISDKQNCKWRKKIKLIWTIKGK